MLNDAKIKAAKATGKRYELVDGAGLYLEVTATGAKIWRYRYRLMGQREKVKIGAYPAVPLTEARARRAELEAMVVRGKSPVREMAREKQLAGQAGTVEELVVLYQADLAKRTKDGGDNMAWHFTAYITPKIGRYPLADITPTDILSFLDGIKKEAPASAVAIHGTTRRMFDFAIGRQLMISNPAAAIPLRVIGEKKARTRALSTTEIGTLLRGLDGARGEPATLLTFPLLLLTMVRREELLGATWGEFDIDEALWTIPGERTKNGKAHVVPLSPQVVAILMELKRIYGGIGLILPGRAPGKGLSTGTLHESMTRNGNFGIERFTPHDFRRTASTILHEQGWNTDVIEKALNHTMKGVRGVYNKAEYLPQRREMLQAWADYLDALKTGAKVVPIGSGKAA
jgi:integrase